MEFILLFINNRFAEENEIQQITTTNLYYSSGIMMTFLLYEVYFHGTTNNCFIRTFHKLV